MDRKRIAASPEQDINSKSFFLETNIMRIDKIRPVALNNTSRMYFTSKPLRTYYLYMQLLLTKAPYTTKHHVAK